MAPAQAAAHPVTLEHVLVPAHDREASARFLSDVLGVECLGLGSTAGPAAFARVRVGPTTLDFVELNDWNGGRGFYFSDPNDGHNLGLLTRPA